MPPGSVLDPLFAELDSFETQVRDLGLAIVAEIFAAELARRQATPAARPAPARPAARPIATRPAAAAVAAGTDDSSDEGADQPATSTATAPSDSDSSDASADAASPSPTRTADAPPRRGPWTRDQVVEELSKWLMGGNPVEAAYLIRHRQRALVTNAKRIFGRFEAALNAANLHLSQKHPDGIPGKKARQTA